jgi:hypothetical protein
MEAEFAAHEGAPAVRMRIMFEDDALETDVYLNETLAEVIDRMRPDWPSTRALFACSPVHRHRYDMFVPIAHEFRLSGWGDRRQQMAMIHVSIRRRPVPIDANHFLTLAWSAIRASTLNGRRAARVRRASEALRCLLESGGDAARVALRNDRRMLQLAVRARHADVTFDLLDATVSSAAVSELSILAETLDAGGGAEDMLWMRDLAGIVMRQRDHLTVRDSAVTTVITLRKLSDFVCEHGPRRQGQPTAGRYTCSHRYIWEIACALYVAVHDARPRYLARQAADAMLRLSQARWNVRSPLATTTSMTQPMSPSSAVLNLFQDLPVLSSDDQEFISSNYACIEVDRMDALRSSYDAVMNGLGGDKRAMATLSFIDVIFTGESGFGLGVARDWASEAAIQIVRAGVMRTCPHDPHVLHPDLEWPTSTPEPDSHSHPHSHPNEELQFAASEHAPSDLWFEFVGRLFALAARMSAPTGYHLSNAFWAMVRGDREPLSLAHLSQLEPHAAASLRAIVDAESDEAITDMSLSGFVVGDEAELLVCGSSDIPVTMENRHLFVQLATDLYCGKLYGRCLDYAYAVREGLRFISGSSFDFHFYPVLRCVDAETFNNTAGGMITVNVPQVRMLTTVTAIFGIDDQERDNTVNTFWSVLESFSVHDRRRLLRFWTGCSSLPSTSAPSLQLVVFPPSRVERLPSSRTCYQQIMLPAVVEGMSAEERMARMSRSLRTAFENSSRLDDD